MINPDDATGTCALIRTPGASRANSIVVLLQQTGVAMSNTDGAGSLLENISARYEQLRASEQKVADVVLADPVAAVEFNMAGLADAAGVSEPTVMRFCGAVGFDGFRTFKIALAQSVALGLPVSFSAIDRSDDTGELVEKIFSHTISSLDRVRRLLDVASTARAIDLMSSASELIFIGFGASGIVAQDAQQKFPLFGVPCQAPADVHQQFIAVSMSRASTVTVAISNTGSTREVTAIARAAKAAGGKVLAITGAEGALSALADVEIRSSTFEDTDFYTPSVSRLGALVIVDLLATGVALRRDTDELERVRLMKERLTGFRDGTADAP
jgi:RpiR family carbohydrate utilization transcriptional regulator